jgi:tetratricopeptide (TPR) repeat protein
VPAFPARESYSRSEVRRILDLPERRLRSWEKQGLAPAVEAYTFTDLVVLRSLIRLSKGGASAVRIRRAVAALRQKLEGIPDPLKDLNVFCEGRHIAVQIGKTRMDADSGQFLLDFDESGLPKTLSFPKQAVSDARRVVQAARLYESSLWFEKALDLENGGAALDEVIAAYEQAVELDPASTGALVNLGTLHFHRKDWTRAEQCYRAAIEADPDYALAYFNLGNLFDEMGDASAAFMHYTTAIRLDPGYADAHYNLALLYQSSGQVMRAVRHWKAYLRLDPGSNWAEIARQELDRLRQDTLIEGARRGHGGADS